jgi:hypothetical protein
MSGPCAIAAGALLTCLSVFAGLSDVRAADRIDVPIKQATLFNGVPRYSIPIVIGGKSVDAILDTGSTGLSILTSAIPASSYTPSKVSLSMIFSNGQKFFGHVGQAVIGLGDAPETATVEINAIDTLECDEKADCASSTKRHDEGLVGAKTFRALVGVSLPSPALVVRVSNPLLRFGDSWIVELPRPGERAPGHLIINPTADERNGFDLFPAGQGFNVGGDRDNPLPGCLVDESDGQKLCAPIVFDSGTPAITEITHDLSPRHWPVGTRGAFSLDAPGGKTIVAKFTVAQTPSMTHVFVGPYPVFNQPAPRVIAGVEPYMLFSVLYDFRRGQIGLKAR